MLRYLILSLALPLACQAMEVTTNDTAIQTAQQQNLPTKFQLPDDLSQWQQATSAYMADVITTSELVEKWQQLLDFTMPTTGEFNPINKTRREATIISSHDRFLKMNEIERLTFLTNLMERHKIYVGQDHQ